MNLTLYQRDAFTDTLFKANPAPVIPLDYWIDDAGMQNIATKNNLAETAFICPSGGHCVFYMKGEIEIL
jgi:PhzF family phenazine biosynthesis protein